MYFIVFNFFFSFLISLKLINIFLYIYLEASVAFF